MLAGYFPLQRGVMDLQLVGQPLGLGRWEGLVEGGRRVGAEVVHHQHGRREKAPGWVSAELGRQQQGSRELQDQGAGLEVKACWYRLSYAVVSTIELDSTSRRSGRLTPELFRAYSDCETDHLACPALEQHTGASRSLTAALTGWP